jgi:hypothetical protein
MVPTPRATFRVGRAVALIQGMHRNFRNPQMDYPSIRNGSKNCRGRYGWQAVIARERPPHLQNGPQQSVKCRCHVDSRYELIRAPDLDRRGAPHFSSMIDCSLVSIESDFFFEDFAVVSRLSKPVHRHNALFG